MSGAGVTRIGQYVIAETLGKGSFGKVKKAVHSETKHTVAVKIINRQKVKKMDMVGKIKREIQILRLFRHPHIIKLYQVISSPNDIFMIMEYVSGGELFDYIQQKGRLTEPEGRKFFQQIISGVDYCHQHMVVHRDLKPENLLLDAHHNVKIADFGLSNIMTDGDFLKTSCGSPNYAAPEVISGKLYAGPEVDVWSCGVILYVLLVGKLPFDDDYVPALFRKIQSGSYNVPQHLSSKAKDLLAKMLVVAPLHRITISKIKEHEWFVIDLPPNLFVEDEDEGSRYDEEIIREICKQFQVLPDIVYNALDQGHRGKAPSIVLNAYRLMCNTKKLRERGQVEANDAEVSADTFFADPARTPKARALQSSLAGEAQQVLLPKIKKTAVASSGEEGRKRRSKWHLGMRSQNSPDAVMGAVYKALKSLNFQWKVITPYHVRCRCWNQVSGTMIKMSLQLFTANSKYYLLDFKNLPTSEADSLRPLALQDQDEGDSSTVHTMEFFELVTLVIKELGK
eukprot:m.45464 g.45464  ORF g.45464 m.45464 type:complete len:510 (-) comp10880_c1_seq3:465-1994(-)